MNGSGKEEPAANCREMEKLALLFAADELSEGEREAVALHAAECEACASLLAAELQLAAAMQDLRQEDVPAYLLAQCRGELNDRLDDAQARSLWGRVAEWIPLRAFMVSRPAWAAAFCVFFGMIMGFAVPRWIDGRQQIRDREFSANATQVSDLDLQSIGISGMSLIPASDSPSPNVEVQFTHQEPRVLRGTLDDSEVRKVLIFIAQNNQRFDSGMRMDSLEALRTRGSDAQVREALCYVARQDRNPGVRLKALEALRGFEEDAQVRSTLLDALLRDQNPGARVEAINALKAMLDKGTQQPDAQLVQVLQDRMRNDPNPYIRLESAAAVRQIAARVP